jgi:hypothetical protein
LTNLSPAAQAVLDAAVASAIQNPFGAYESDVAAALCAAADQVEPDDGIPTEVQRVLDKLLAIADELDKQ